MPVPVATIYCGIGSIPFPAQILGLFLIKGREDRCVIDADNNDFLGSVFHLLPDAEIDPGK
jgi:hypothetical protein